jgi:predicted RNase H-like HicB family nuclease
VCDFGPVGVPAYDAAAMAKRMRQLNVVIERDADGFLVAWVPALPGCHTQARTHDQLAKRIREAIELCLEIGGGPLRRR